MAVVYDPAKSASNLRKHGITFADAETVLSDSLALTVATRRERKTYES